MNFLYEKTAKIICCRAFTIQQKNEALVEVMEEVDDDELYKLITLLRAYSIQQKSEVITEVIREVWHHEFDNLLALLRRDKRHVHKD